MFKKSFYIIVFILTASCVMYAQDEIPATNNIGIGLGPQIGWQKSSSADNGNIMFGVGLRLRVSEAIGLEGSINYRSEQYADGALTVKTWPIMVSGLIYPVNYFYGIVGIGWYNTSFDYSSQIFPAFENNTQQNFGWHLGAGLEIPAGDAVKVTGDVRYAFLNYDFGDLEQAAASGDLISNFFVITLGVSFAIHL